MSLLLFEQINDDDDDDEVNETNALVNSSCIIAVSLTSSVRVDPIRLCIYSSVICDILPVFQCDHMRLHRVKG